MYKMNTIDKINYYLARQGKNGAGLCAYLGVSNGVYSQWNTGRTSPRKSKLPLIAEYLGVTVEDLLPDEGIKKEPSVPKDEELDKNDALWETYDGLSEATKNLPLNEANLIFKILSDGEQGMNFNELYAFASVLSKLSPDERLRLFQLADRIQQDKSEP